MKRLLRPGLLWPLFVIALLLLSMGMSVRAVIASRADGGVEPVPDYYAQAARYDELSRAQAASDALGWTMTAAAGALQPSGLREIGVTLLDAAGQPVEAATGELRVSRPSRIDTLATVPFHARAAGAYAALIPMQDAGLWDVTVTVRRGDARFTRTVRLELP